MDAIIHIGLNKAGSTSIQHWLTENSPVLATGGIGYARHRFLPPSPRYGTQHVELLLPAAAVHGLRLLRPAVKAELALTDRAAIAAAADRYTVFLRDQLAGSDMARWVFSSEYLAGRRTEPAHVTTLDAWLHDIFDTVRYVLYLRDPADWLSSRYSQAVLHGSVLSLDAFLEHHAEPEIDQRLRAWHSAVGPARLDVRLLERDFLIGGDLIADFSHVIGATDLPTRRVPRFNEGLDPASLEELRVFNMAHADAPKDSFKKTRARLIARLRTTAQTAPALRLDATQRARVAARHATALKWIRDTYFPEREALFSTPQAPAPSETRSDHGARPPKPSDPAAATTPLGRLRQMWKG